jgi:putative hydrolase of the HAD superfamily
MFLIVESTFLGYYLITFRGIIQIDGSNRMKIDTVLFDLDQTLLDKEQSLVNFSEYQYQYFRLNRFIREKEIYKNRFVELNSITIPKNIVYEKLVDEFGIDRSLYYQLLEDLNNNFPKYCVGYDGMIEMLKSLKKEGIKLGIISNGRGFYQKHKIECLGIVDFFDDIVISGYVNLRKPDLEIFKLALNHLDSEAEKTVFVGDSVMADIIPAKELGMYTIHKCNELSNRYADATCDNLIDIPNLIMTI